MSICGILSLVSTPVQFVRVIAVALALSAANLPHMLFDAVGIADSDHCSAGCEDEGNEAPCSPLCTTCSCTHTARPMVIVATAAAPFLFQFNVGAISLPTLGERTQPPVRIFHPPKA